MAPPRVGLWMYQNSGGTDIERNLVARLNERNIEAITGLDLGEASAHNGSIFCNGHMMDELDLFFSYNAGQQTPYQVYLYQTLSSMIPTINNYAAFELTEDKFRTAHLLKKHGIPTPDYIVCNKNNIEQLREHLRFWQGKAICKPVNGWGGNGIIKLESERDLDLIHPYITKQSSPQFYIERVIENDFTDYRIDVVDNKFVACYGRKAASGSWKTNVTSGGSVICREPTPEVIELALKAAKVTGLEVAGVDIIYDIEHQQYVVLEVNGIPAFATPDQEKAGLNFNDTKIAYLVDLIERTVCKEKTQKDQLSELESAVVDLAALDLAATSSPLVKEEIL
ncbi:ATP-grasp domain-containing protein [Photobacterium alginatilyticum]|uniref:ATP-grasp domain-containing protein n=1 Tax=Photobacterium alginatilyticum TaxID=1775171 RepID=A0ABW9YHW0_9GAMM|nr:sugar-transfer associated ATP-grasp domain-containing protein [Photobacterium alginatilyticum]NBI53323.1 ATP-grasp domain-containing protein [Photobacterium alginatilyticum]